MSLKDGWQLVIIDSEDKQQKVREAFEAAGAEDGDAAWIGFENDDGKNFYGAHNVSPTSTMLVTNIGDLTSVNDRFGLCHQHHLSLNARLRH